MSRSTRLLPGFAALALLLVACGGGSSPAPDGATAQPGSTATAPAATQTETAAPTDAGTVPDITTGAAALADLDSYHMTVTMAMAGVDSSLYAGFGDGLVMDATVVTEPVKAVDMTVSMGAADQKLEMGYRVIGDKAWMNLGSWVEAPTEDAEEMIDGFSPEKMFGNFSVTGLNAVGDETKNGISTTHYAATGTEYAADLNEMFGIANGTWAVDYWVAKEGGYPVAYTVEGKGTNGASFLLALDISDINSPSNVVEPPPAS